MCHCPMSQAEGTFWVTLPRCRKLGATSEAPRKRCGELGVQSGSGSGADSSETLDLALFTRDMGRGCPAPGAAWRTGRVWPLGGLVARDGVPQRPSLLSFKRGARRGSDTEPRPGTRG